jgi:Recombination directionality factor-like
MEGRSWELYTEANRIHVYVPPTMALSQWCEQWKGGGLVCRCDGETIQKHINPERVGTPCTCPEGAEKPCEDMTRFSVFLPDLPGG